MRLPSDEPLTDDLLRARLDLWAAEGYQTDEELIEAAIEELADEFREDVGDVEERVRRMAPDVLDARQRLERSWPVPTDCDRLDRAFARLEAAGIVARQDFTCCRTCGYAEIGGEVDEADEDVVRGFTFFHHQDTEHAVDGDGLYLAYGAFSREEADEKEQKEGTARIGREVVAALQAEGLQPSWSGEPGQRIHLPMTWRRRRRR